MGVLAAAALLACVVAPGSASALDELDYDIKTRTLSYTEDLLGGEPLRMGVSRHVDPDDVCSTCGNGRAHGPLLLVGSNRGFSATDSARSLPLLCRRDVDQDFGSGDDMICNPLAVDHVRITARDGDDRLGVRSLGYTGEIHAGEGNDEIYALTEHDDFVDTGPGSDLVQPSGGDDTILGGTGVDRIDGGEGDDEIDGGYDGDIITGGRGNDELTGGLDDDLLLGERGKDILDGGAGDDGLNGGNGLDFVRYDADKLKVDLKFGCCNGERGVEKDVLAKVEGVLANANSSVITGTNKRNVIVTGKGRDLIDAKGGDDDVYSGGGTDIVHARNGDDEVGAGTGNDFVSGGGGRDKIDVFKRGKDRGKCGSKKDTLWADDSDVFKGCETVNRKRPKSLRKTEKRYRKLLRK